MLAVKLAVAWAVNKRREIAIMLAVLVHLAVALPHNGEDATSATAQVALFPKKRRLKA